LIDVANTFIQVSGSQVAPINENKINAAFIGRNHIVMDDVSTAHIQIA